MKQEISVDNNEIIEEVPNIAQFVETSGSLKSAYQYLHNTRIGDDENIHDYPSLTIRSVTNISQPRNQIPISTTQYIITIDSTDDEDD